MGKQSGSDVSAVMATAKTPATATAANMSNNNGVASGAEILSCCTSPGAGSPHAGLVPRHHKTVANERKGPGRSTPPGAAAVEAESSTAKTAATTTAANVSNNNGVAGFAAAATLDFCNYSGEY